MPTHKNIYQLVTDRIIAHLEKGVVPWKQPWTDNRPRNFVTGKAYRGLNILLLNSLGYKDNLFLTFEQARGLKASVKKGEKAHLVIFYKREVKKNKETDQDELRFYLRYYWVFNVEQCTGLPPNKFQQVSEEIVEPIEACEQVLWNMPKCPVIHEEYDKGAFYNPATDEITLPPKAKFLHVEGYYGTLFHELTHSTGHHSRLNRKEIVEPTHFASYDYSIEELTAEIGACYLLSLTGIATEDLSNHASYISGWLEKLRGDNRLILHASSQAQRATDYILNVAQPIEVETVSYDAEQEA